MDENLPLSSTNVHEKSKFFSSARRSKQRVGTFRGADRYARMQVNNDLRFGDRVVDAIEREELGGESEARPHFGFAPARDASGLRTHKELAPGVRARVAVVEIRRPDFGETLQKV